MKQIAYCTVFLLAILTLYSCDGQRINGSGNISTETRNVGSYNKVKLRGSMNLEFTQGPEKEAVIEADDNIIPYILLEKEGNELVIRMKDNISVNSHKDIIVRLTAPDVTEFSLSGSGNINLKNTIEQDSPIRFKLAGMGDIEGRVNSPAVKISSAGSGNINLEGETKDLNISIAGSGNFKGTGLHTENTTVSIAGSGDAAVHASVTLVAKIAGSGDINYSGNPTVTSKIAGSGSVHKRDE